MSSGGEMVAVIDEDGALAVYGNGQAAPQLTVNRAKASPR